METLKKNQRELSLGCFCVIALAVVLVAVFVFHVPAVPVCVLAILESALAAVLHRMELWVHGVLVIAEIVAGYLLDRTVLVLLCVVAYIAATIALQFFTQKES